MNLTFETGRAQSELFAFQCSQWELIWNSQLIGRYKEMSPGESYIWNWQSTEWTLCFSMRSMRAHLKQSINRKIKRNVTRWILRYNPPFETGRARSEYLHFTMRSMRAHLKQSTNRKIKRNVTRWILWSIRPHLKQSTNRKISRNVTRWILWYNSPFETGRAQSELFTFQCGQWELIWNSQLIGRYKEMSPGESYGQLDPIWNSQLIGRYKEMSPGESYGQLDPIWNSQLIGRYKEMSPGESYCQLDPIWNSQLIGRYKELSPGESYDLPPIWNCQSSEWTLHFSMRSMRAHLKQSTNRKI